MIDAPLYAQTNVRLVQEVSSAGFADADVIRVQQAYIFGRQLFSGAYRGSGKPLLAHLIGTASVLTRIGQPLDVIIAGLLHAAYALGEFGDGRTGMTDQKRTVVRVAVGDATETLIAHYTRLPWTRTSIPEMRGREHTLDAADRAALIIRLANELEDHHDGSVLFCANAEARLAQLADVKDTAIAIADALAIPELRTAMERVFTAALAERIPAAWRQCQDYTFFVAPASHRPRWIVSLRRCCDRHKTLTILARGVARPVRLARRPLESVSARLRVRRMPHALRRHHP